MKNGRALHITCMESDDFNTEYQDALIFLSKPSIELSELKENNKTKVVLQEKSDSVDSTKIKDYVINDRQIPCLLHFTTIENFANIFQTGGILSRKLLSDNNLVYTPFDKHRYDGCNDCVNLSIGIYNFHMFYKCIKDYSRTNLLLWVNPNLLWKEGTKFCPVNAAYERGKYITSGYSGLKSLFDDIVYDLNRPQTRNGKPNWIPTSIQAEVLVPEGIDLQLVRFVVVYSIEDSVLIRKLGWKGRIIISPIPFQYRGDWINK